VWHFESKYTEYQDRYGPEAIEAARRKNKPKPPGFDVICNKCGHPQNIVFASHKVITCEACGQNPVGL
jgi:ribosomal protein S27E